MPNLSAREEGTYPSPDPFTPIDFYEGCCVWRIIPLIPLIPPKPLIEKQGGGKDKRSKSVVSLTQQPEDRDRRRPVRFWIHTTIYPKINIGDVGYRFLKEFDSGWYNGTVIEILPDAIGGWDRRCVYEDGDCEDLALNELIRLATLYPQEHVSTIKVVGDVEMAVTGKCQS